MYSCSISDLFPVWLKPRISNILVKTNQTLESPAFLQYGLQISVEETWLNVANSIEKYKTETSFR